MKIRDVIYSANTGLDAIKRAPVLEYPTDLRCIRIQDISQGKPFSEWAYTKTTTNDYKKFKLCKNDVLVARTGATVGVSYLVKEDIESVFNNGSIRLRVNENANAKFLYYLINTKEFLTFIDNVSCVATQPNLRIENLLRFDFPDYSVEKQTKIANILSTYDELIEKNNKRIKLLEQMAENLYKEWFVRFRFPDYEAVDFEEKKPFGWIVSSCENTKIPSCFDYCEFSELGSFTRGRNITAAEMVEGEIPVISAGLQPSGYHNKANVTGRSLTISASGANAGYLQYNLSDIWAADCSYYQNEKNLWFVYCTLKFLQPVISNLQCGAAQPHVYPKNINKLCVLQPTDELIVKFNQTVEPFFDEIETLKKKNDNLTKQRDLLLPRLMSGKLEV